MRKRVTISVHERHLVFGLCSQAHFCFLCAFNIGRKTFLHASYFSIILLRAWSFHCMNTSSMEQWPSGISHQLLSLQVTTYFQIFLCLN
ncbi:hypothetical protein Patl1_37291 [Pistacia atlantica]|nr:hypothetical protein Patl1_37291 [Pistacia atlantica]